MVALVAAIAERLGPVEVLVLNATGPQPEAPLDDVAWADHVAQLEFFVKSPVLLGRAALPAMRERRFGRIVQIDSEVADRPPPGTSAYATAKSAQIGLTRSWARELAHLGITVNTVAPGSSPSSATRMWGRGPKLLSLGDCPQRVRNRSPPSTPSVRRTSRSGVVCRTCLHHSRNRSVLSPWSTWSVTFCSRHSR